MRIVSKKLIVYELYVIAVVLVSVGHMPMPSTVRCLSGKSWHWLCIG